MPKLIQVGSVIVNMEMMVVARRYFLTGEVVLVMASVVGESGGGAADVYELRFGGAEARALAYYLELAAYDVMSSPL